MIDPTDPDLLCPVWALRTFSDCVCPKASPSAEGIEFAREMRLVRAELQTREVRK